MLGGRGSPVGSLAITYSSWTTLVILFVLPFISVLHLFLSPSVPSCTYTFGNMAGPHTQNDKGSQASHCPIP